MKAGDTASPEGFHLRDALSGAVTMLVIIITILFFAWKRLFKQIRRREQHLAVTSAQDLDTDTLRHALGQVLQQAAWQSAIYLHGHAGLPIITCIVCLGHNAGVPTSMHHATDIAAQKQTKHCPTCRMAIAVLRCKSFDRSRVQSFALPSFGQHQFPAA